MLRRPLLYLRTARHLRVHQLLDFVTRRLRPARVSHAAGALVNRERASAMRIAIAPLMREPNLEEADRIVAHRFCFLNQAETLPRIDWRRRYVSHLWNYQLQYFDYALNLAASYHLTADSRYLRNFESFVSNWIEGTAKGEGDGWEPYPIAVRSVNWIYSYLLIGDSLQPALRQQLLESIVSQLSHLEQRLEWHLMANHLIKDLRALLIGGLLFDGPDAARWRALSRKHLWAQIGEQVLDDGGHFERAPMYHVLVLRDLLEVALLAPATGVAVPTDVLEKLRRMTAATGSFYRDDESLHLFGDSAQGLAGSMNSLNDLSAQAIQRRFERPSGAWSLPATGYYGFASSDAEISIDCGEVGADYQPGHGHADCLSYELTIGGKPVIVDSGVHGYEGDPFREYVRSTRAHNTVVIDGKDQSEMWATFRVARRARIIGATSSVEGGVYRFEGAYRPYHDTRCSHRRWVTCERGRVVIGDVVEGAQGEVIESFIHLYPDLKAVSSATDIIITGYDASLKIVPFGADEAAVIGASKDPVQGYYCPEFGKAIPQSVIVIRKHRNDGREFGYHIEWAT